jgi:hypothetical protein
MEFETIMIMISKVVMKPHKKKNKDKVKLRLLHNSMSFEFHFFFIHHVIVMYFFLISPLNDQIWDIDTMFP